MSPNRKKVLSTALFAACAGALFSVAQGSLAANTDTVNAAITEQTKAEQAAVSSQKKIEQLDDEASKAVASYRQMITEAQSLKEYNEQLAAQVDSQNGQITEMTQQISEIETTSREVLPLMNRMLETLEQFIALDVPFLTEERATRLAQLKAMMGRADVSTSEKYRRLVEAYQIEVEYGRTLEVYQGKVDDKTVEILRTGRVSLMYRTLDGKETGYWDVDNKKWVGDNSYREPLNKALKVAKKQAAPDFIEVAIHAPKEVTR
jgi:chromosome segregation ATPase